MKVNVYRGGPTDISAETATLPVRNEHYYARRIVQSSGKVFIFTKGITIYIITYV